MCNLNLVSVSLDFIFGQNPGKMTLYLPLPLIFQTSYLNRDTFPSNCIQRTISTYPSALAEYATRLEDAAGDLCETDVGNVDLSIRDLRTNNGAGKGQSCPHSMIIWRNP